MDLLGLDLAQLHGDEWPEEVQALGRRAIKVFRSLPVTESQLARFPSVWGYLVDTPNPKLFGGTGVVWDWSSLRTVSSQRPILVAGGITPRTPGAPWPRAAPPGRRRLGRGVGAGGQGRREAGAAVRGGRGVSDLRGRHWPDAARAVRGVRRAVRARDADGAARRARARLRRGAGATAPSAAGSTSCSRTTPAARRRSTFARRGCRGSSAAARIFLKREDLLHTGAHKINNALGQACSRGG